MRCLEPERATLGLFHRALELVVEQDDVSDHDPGFKSILADVPEITEDIVVRIKGGYQPDAVQFKDHEIDFHVMRLVSKGFTQRDAGEPLETRGPCDAGQIFRVHGAALVGHHLDARFEARNDAAVDEGRRALAPLEAVGAELGAHRLLGPELAPAGLDDGLARLGAAAGTPTNTSVIVVTSLFTEPGRKGSKSVKNTELAATNSIARLRFSIIATQIKMISGIAASVVFDVANAKVMKNNTAQPTLNQRILPLV